MSPESISEVSGSIASAASPALEVSAPQVFSGIPAPEIPSSIITEISRPAGLSENEFLPSPITGNFDIKDIIAAPVEAKINQVHIEPAVFLPPKTVEEIFKLPRPNKDLQHEHNQTPNITFEIAKPFSPDLAPEAASAKINVAEKSDEEKAADRIALGQALAILKGFLFEDDEKEIWEQKLTAAVNTPQPESMARNLISSLQVMPKPDTQTSPLTQTETSPQLLDQTHETKTQTAVAPEDAAPQTVEDQPKTALREKEKPWVMYLIDDEWEYAKRSNQIRLEDARSLGQNLASSENPLQDAEREVPKLDVPSIEETLPILAGNLKRPFIEHKIKHALGSVKENDPNQIAQTITDVVAKNPSKEKRAEIKAALRVMPEQMPKGARELISQGAKSLIYKTGTAWKSVRRLNFKEPVEAEKAT